MAKTHTITRTDAIAAIASGHQDSAIGIIRASGEESWDIASRLFMKAISKIEPRKFYLKKLLDPESNEFLDEAMVAFFQANSSYTGEPMVEIFTHGGQINIKSILEKLFLQGMRQALPGEFTRRAFLNGKINLHKAMAIKALASAKTPFGLIQARKHMKGSFAVLVDALRGLLIGIIVELEGTLELEENGLMLDEENVSNNLRLAMSKVRVLRGPKNFNVQEQLKVVLIGAPNVGKSSLFNVLTDKDRAIVWATPGTTRDFLEITLQFGPYEVTLVDTAGLGDPTDPIEEVGVSKTMELIKQSNVLLFLHDLSHPDPNKTLETFNKEDLIIVGTKKDLAPQNSGFSTSTDINVSAKTSEGISSLKEIVTGRLKKIEAYTSEEVFAIDGFQRECFDKASEHLSSSIALLKTREPLEIISYEVGQALKEIDGLLGKSLDFEIMDGLFSTFCIGK